MAGDARTGRSVAASISYFGGAPEKPRFHANDHGRDNWRQDVREVVFHDARGWSDPPRLDREGVAEARFLALFN